MNGGTEMDVREKLVELLRNSPHLDTIKGYKGNDCTFEQGADWLISKGVTVRESNGCEYCKEYEDLPEHFVNGKPVGRVFDTCIQTDENGRWHLEVPSGADIGIKFCPVCGRKLPPPKGE